MRHLDLLNGLPLEYSTRFTLTCNPSPPPAPDYVGAAKEQGEQNLQAARTSGRLNNPNYINPYGTQTVSYGEGFNQQGWDAAQAQYQRDLQRYRSGEYETRMVKNPAYRTSNGGDNRGGGETNIPQFIAERVPMAEPTAPNRYSFISGDIDQPTVTQTFSPAQQAIFDEQNKAKLLLNQLAGRGASTAKGIIGEPVDLSGAPATGSYDDTRQKVIDAYMSRANEDFARRWENERSGLLAAGINPSTEAYGTARHMNERARNDAYQQAEIYGGNAASQAYGMDEARRRQYIAELMSERNQPLNEITALMHGGQINNPFAVQGYHPSANVAPAPTFAGMQAGANYNTDLYNAEAAAAGNMQSGLIGLGGTAMMAAAMF